MFNFLKPRITQLETENQQLKSAMSQFTDMLVASVNNAIIQAETRAKENSLTLEQKIRSDAITFAANRQENKGLDINKVIRDADKLVNYILRDNKTQEGSSLHVIGSPLHEHTEK